MDVDEIRKEIDNFLNEIESMEFDCDDETKYQTKMEFEEFLKEG